MINVKLNRKINGHLKKGTPGRISDNDFNLWGVGLKVTPRTVTLYFDGDEMAILNTNLELDENNGRSNIKTAAKEQISLL